MFVVLNYVEHHIVLSLTIHSLIFRMNFVSYNYSRFAEQVNRNYSAIRNSSFARFRMRFAMQTGCSSLFQRNKFPSTCSLNRIHMRIVIVLYCNFFARISLQGSTCSCFVCKNFDPCTNNNFVIDKRNNYSPIGTWFGDCC